jgi:DNA-binding GntR family transcriptional regulator
LTPSYDGFARDGSEAVDGRRQISEETRLDRKSFVPLYYQLQEILKQQIESGHWRTGDALPSEHALARRFGISRVVVRQALAILADDRQVERIKGRGTFVAPPKLESRAGGLTRLMSRPRDAGVQVRVLQKRVVSIESSVQNRLASDSNDALNVTFALSVSGHVVAISHSFFRLADATWLDTVAHVGAVLDLDRPSAPRLDLAHSEVSIETSQCGNFEADSFGIPPRAPVFLVHCVEFVRDRTGVTRPVEFARVVYRADEVQFRLELTDGPSEPNLAALWALTAPTHHI